MKAKQQNTFLLIFFASSIILGILGSLFIPVPFLINFYIDDGFFYLKIAKNFANGLGSTFDGVSYTNGYHPLWFIILTIIFFFTSLFTANPPPELLFRISTLLQHGLIVLTLYITYRSFRLFFKESAFKRFLLFLALFLAQITLKNFGTEIHITVFLLSIYLLLKGQEIYFNRRNDTLKSFVIMFLGLTRFEYLFTLVPILILYESHTRARGGFVKNLVMYSLPAAAAAVIYLTINYIYFEHLMPISAVIKSTFPRMNILEYLTILYNGWRYHPFTISVLLYFISAVSFLILKMHSGKKKGRLSRLNIFLFWISAGLGAFLLPHFFFNVKGIHEWYLPGISFVSTVIFISLLNRISFAATALTVILLALYAVSFYYIRIANQKHSDMYVYTCALRNLVSANETILQMDYCGVTSFFSNRNLISGDGLTNDFEYYEHLRHSNIQSYIKNKGIDYYSTYTAKIDTSAGIVSDMGSPLWKNIILKFPLEKLRYRQRQTFQSASKDDYFEWTLIYLK